LSWEIVIGALEQAGLLARTAAEPATYLPARPLDGVEIKEALDAVRTVPEASDRRLVGLRSEAAADRIIALLDRAVSRQLRGLTLKEFAQKETGVMDPVLETTGQRDAPSDEEAKGPARTAGWAPVSRPLN
jgi:hypothetical protein